MNQKSMSADEKAFRAKIKENPKDSAPKAVFADWLDERGRHFEAEFWRAEAGIQLNVYGIHTSYTGQIAHFVYRSIPELQAEIRRWETWDRRMIERIEDIVVVPLRPSQPVITTLGDWRTFHFGRAVGKSGATWDIYKHATRGLFDED